MRDDQIVADGTAVTATITIPFNGAYWENQAEYVDIIVTAKSGTSPTLSPVYKTWNSSTNAWVTKVTATEITGTGTTRIPLVYGSVDTPSELVLTVGGSTPSFTLGIHHRDV